MTTAASAASRSAFALDLIMSELETQADSVGPQKMLHPVLTTVLSTKRTQPLWHLIDVWLIIGE